jgi:sortase A
MTSAAEPSARRLWLERLLIAVGLVCLGWAIYASIRPALYRYEQAQEIQRLAHPSARPEADAARPGRQTGNAGSRNGGGGAGFAAADGGSGGAEGGTATDGRGGAGAAAHGGTAADGRGDAGAAAHGGTAGAGAGTAGAGASAGAADAALTPGELIGTLEVARLNFSALVAEGDDASTLRAAIGHLPDTPLPWSSGNSALAGHRDVQFRPLRNIRLGDEITLTTSRGTFRYRIRETKIVQPDDLSVLAPTTGRTLTLITCYPFVYIGHAPKRFIVHADALP